MAVNTYSLKNDGNKYLTKNFQVKEFACHDGDDFILIDYTLVLKLQKLRDKIGAPIIITSGYRTKSYNKKIGGASNSYHCEGKAADIYCKYYNVKDLARWAQPLWINGIGRYDKQGFIHVDTRKNIYYWLGSEQTKIDTFGSIPSYKISDIANLKEALTADGWSMDNLCNKYDERLDNILKYTNITRKSQGNGVKLVQACVGTTVDGFGGRNTEQAIRKWQYNHGLTVDGCFGYNCWKKAIEQGV